MNLANANQQSILLDDTWTYRLPYERPSGDLVVFGRQKGGDTAPEFGRLIGLAANTPQVANLSEVSLDTSGLRWAPGGEMLVTLRGGVLLLVVPTATQGLPLPISDAVAYSWGPSPVEHANAVPEAVGIFFRAPGLDNLVQIWQVGSDGTALPLTGSEADVTAYAVSPDGRRLVYASAGELRLQPLNVTEEPLVLAQIGTQSVSGIAFSPDGGQVAYALDSDNQHPAGGIYIVPASGGEAALLLQNGPEGESPVYAPPFYRDPQFAPNVNALLVRESGSETTSFLMLDLNTDERLRVGSYDATFWLRDGRLIAYGNGIGIGDPPPTTPIYLIATDALDRPVQIAALPAPRIIRAIQEITSGRLRLAVADNVPGPSPLDVLDIAIATGEETVITRAGFIAQPALSRDGQILAGIVNPGSLLTVYDLFNRQQLALDSPLGVADFRWPLR
jgi:Tol biopolymer transport system component